MRIETLILVMVVLMPNADIGAREPRASGAAPAATDSRWFQAVPRWLSGKVRKLESDQQTRRAQLAELFSLLDSGGN